MPIPTKLRHGSVGRHYTRGQGGVVKPINMARAGNAVLAIIRTHINGQTAQDLERNVNSSEANHIWYRKAHS